MDPVPLFFVLGAIGRYFKSELRLPGPIYEVLAIYLLLAIGLKGGVEMARSFQTAMLLDIAAACALGVTTALVAFSVFRLRLERKDAASLCAHYGSVSIVTFAVASQFLTARGVGYESHLSLLAAVMEAPALVVAALLAHRSDERHEGASVGTVLHEVLTNRSLLLLFGGLVIGILAGPQGKEPLRPLFVDLFKGTLCLFLLEMGWVAADRLKDIRHAGAYLVVCGIALPLLNALLGLAVAMGLDFSTGGTVLLMTLAASASYIAAPTAMKLAIPEANPALGITSALAITFPFNILLGIPLYLWITQQMGTS